MRMMKLATIVFLLNCAVFTMPLYGVEVKPANVVLPTSAGETFSFDLVINDPTSTTAYSFQSTIGVSVSGSGASTFSVSSSEAVDSVAGYWLYGNSAGATALDLGSNNYQFGDNPDDGNPQLLATDDIIARYAFTWDGIVDDYTFTLDFDTANSFVQNDSFVNEALQFNQGGYSGSGGSFTIYNLPEPTTLMLMGLGTAVLLRKRKA